jgi:hypothetical protein
MPEQAPKKDWGGIPMSPRAREFYTQVYLPRIMALQREIEATPLVVLIWRQVRGVMISMRNASRTALSMANCQIGLNAVVSPWTKKSLAGTIRM